MSYNEDEKQNKDVTNFQLPLTGGNRGNWCHLENPGYCTNYHCNCIDKPKRFKNMGITTFETSRVEN